MLDTSLFMLFMLSALPDGRVFGLDQQTLVQIVANTLNLAFLAVVLTFLLHKPVRKFMAARTQRITSQVENAALEAQKAQELRAEYEKKLAEIAIEREEILERARRAAAENSKQIVAAAKAEAVAIHERTAAEIEHERELVRAQMKQVIIEVSAEMTEKILQAKVDEQTYERMFEQTLGEMEHTQWLR